MNNLHLLAPCAVVFAVGCGGSAVVLQSNDGGSDAAFDADNSGGDAGDAAATTTKVGFVSLRSTNAPAANPPGDSTDMFLSFELAGSLVQAFGGEVPLSPGCTAEPVVDGCAFIDCVSPAPPSTSTPVSAGTILVSGGKQPVTLTPNYASYHPPPLPAHLWEGGEALQIVVAGAVAPAFDLSLIAPSYVTIIKPVWPTGGAPLAIPRAYDLPFIWSGGGAGNVNLVFSLTDDKGSLVVACTYPAKNGTGKVTAKVLGMLPPNAAFNRIDISSQTLVQKNVSDWTMNFGASAAANTPTGVASATVTFQ